MDTLRAQLSAVTRHNHHLTDRLKEFADYPLVQEEKVELQAQVKLLKRQLEDLQKENHILRESECTLILGHFNFLCITLLHN